MITKQIMEEIESLLYKKKSAEELLSWIKEEGDCGAIEINIRGKHIIKVGVFEEEPVEFTLLHDSVQSQLRVILRNTIKTCDKRLSELGWVEEE